LPLRVAQRRRTHQNIRRPFEVIVDQPARELGVTRQTCIQNGFVLRIDIAIFTAEREGEMPVTLALGIEHGPQIEQPWAVATRGERGVKGGVCGDPSVIQSGRRVGNNDRNAMEPVVSRND